jgi:hypothetical protein
LLFALKGVGNRAFYRWVNRDYQALFSHSPERTRLFRLVNRHHPLTDRFMAEPTLLGVVDSYGIELIHPRREGRSEQQTGRKGASNQRWIVGGKLCFVLNHLGPIVDWECDRANVYDGANFQDVVERQADDGFAKKGWHPDNLRLCHRGEWNSRMIVETVLSMLTLVSHFKKVMHRAWVYFESRLAYTMALFNLLVQWDGIQVDDAGCVHFELAPFSP